MKLPIDLFKANISPRKVYYFSSKKLKSTEPHYYICVARTEDEMLILVCCTSQYEKRKRFIETRNFPFSTLVWVNPDNENGLTKDSFVDCNSYFDYSVNEFANLYQVNKLDFKGEILVIHFEQILIGLSESPLIEQTVKNLLK